MVRVEAPVLRRRELGHEPVRLPVVFINNPLGGGVLLCGLAEGLTAVMETGQRVKQVCSSDSHTMVSGDNRGGGGGSPPQNARKRDSLGQHRATPPHPKVMVILAGIRTGSNERGPGGCNKEDPGPRSDTLCLFAQFLLRPTGSRGVDGGQRLHPRRKRAGDAAGVRIVLAGQVLHGVVSGLAIYL